MKKGYFGIGIYEGKSTDNVGTLWRAAYLYGADFIFTISHRYKYQPTDTQKTSRHIPLFNYVDYDDFIRHIPENGELVFIEQADGNKKLNGFNHPKQAIYILGAEDTGIPTELMKNNRVVEIESLEPNSMNVSMAGTLVMYDRFIKELSK